MKDLFDLPLPPPAQALRNIMKEAREQLQTAEALKSKPDIIGLYIQVRVIDLISILKAVRS